MNRLTLRNTGFECNDVEHLANALEGSSTVLDVLDLSQNSIADIGAVRLANMFIRTPIMREMYLYKNDELSRAGADSLSEAKVVSQRQEGRRAVLICL